MTTNDRASQLRTEIQRADATIDPISLDEVLASASVLSSEDLSSDNGSRSRTEHPDTQEWLVPTTQPVLQTVQTSHWFRLAAVAAVLIAMIGALLLALTTTSGPLQTDPADGDGGSNLGLQALAPSPVEIVEARYRSMLDLDLVAIHAPVAADVTYCKFFFASNPNPEGCAESNRGYHGLGGWGESDERVALRTYAYGGVIEFTCNAQGAVVTCDQAETHLLLTAAGADRPADTVTYVVDDGQIISIRYAPSEPPGLVDTQVRTQEVAYANWVKAEHPDQFAELFSLGQPILNTDTAARHRQLVPEWITSR